MRAKAFIEAKTHMHVRVAGLSTPLLSGSVSYQSDVLQIHVLPIHLLQMHLFQVHHLQIHVLQILPLQIHIFQIQSIFYNISLFLSSYGTSCRGCQVVKITMHHTRRGCKSISSAVHQLIASFSTKANRCTCLVFGAYVTFFRRILASALFIPFTCFLSSHFSSLFYNVRLHRFAELLLCALIF